MMPLTARLGSWQVPAIFPLLTVKSVPAFQGSLRKHFLCPILFFFVTHIHLPEGAGYPWDEPIACLLELCQRHGCIAAGAVLEEGKDSYR